MIYRAIWGIAMLTFNVPQAAAVTICTIIKEAKSGDTVHQEGDCNVQVTPASTFKIPLSVMGFESGFLVVENAPRLNYQSGDPNWGGQTWMQPTGPEEWMKYSVVWYSQRITHSLGEDRLKAYVESFGYGNADLSGDPGKANGLDRAWISSSLKVSPAEQVKFLRRLVNYELPVRKSAVEKTARITKMAQNTAGWEIHGKTGTAFPRNAAGIPDEARGYGWFVGWANKGSRTLVFARLTQDEQTHVVPAGLRVRDQFLAEWKAMTEQETR